jgi:hypothetical protein
MMVSISFLGQVLADEAIGIFIIGGDGQLVSHNAA